MSDDSVIHPNQFGPVRYIDDQGKKEIITKKEFIKILKCCDDDEYGLRARFAFLIMYNCGIRTKELLGLKIDDFMENGELIPYFTTVLTKGRKRTLHIHEITLQALKNYLDVRSIDSIYIFASYKNPNKVMSRNGFYNFMKKKIKRAKIEKAITPYTFRRTGITNDAKAGMSLAEIGLKSGNSPQTIMKHYLQDSKERAKSRSKFVDMDF